MTTGQLIYLIAVAECALAYVAVVTGGRLVRRVRRWAYSPRRTFGRTRVTMDEALTEAMRRHPAGRNVRPATVGTHERAHSPAGSRR